MSTQADHGRCECGAAIVIRPTVSPWEFEYACEACRRGGVISWTREEPPPRYVVTPAREPLPLFETKP